MTKSDRYFIRYDINFDLDEKGFTPDQVAEYGDDPGACDAFIFHSICFPKDRSGIARTEELITVDGRTGMDLSADDFVASWLAMTFGLAQHPELSPEQRNRFEKVGDLYLRRFHPDIATRRARNKQMQDPKLKNRVD